ncbi:hypothetical protein ACFQX6_32685 [Streptosporangium lutulentum]
MCVLVHSDDRSRVLALRLERRGCSGCAPTSRRHPTAHRTGPDPAARRTGSDPTVRHPGPDPATCRTGIAPRRPRAESPRPGAVPDRPPDARPRERPKARTSCGPFGR